MPPSQDSKDQDEQKVKVDILNTDEQAIWAGIRDKNICHTTRCTNTDPTHVHFIAIEGHMVHAVVDKINNTFRVFRSADVDGTVTEMTAQEIDSMCGYMLKTAPKQKDAVLEP